MRTLSRFAMISAMAWCAASAPGAVIITEIMYNPVGGGDGVVPPSLSSEWVEIYNTGPAAVDISGWRLDDEDSSDWGPVPAGSIVLPGEAAILAATDDEFKQTWGATIKVFEVVWGQIANSPSATNEVLELLDAGNVQIDLVNFEVNTNGWPAGPNGASIYLTDFNASNDVGSNWATSVAGTDGAYSFTTPVAPYGAPTSVVDTGSPGIVVPEPVGLLMCCVGGMFMRRGRSVR